MQLKKIVDVHGRGIKERKQPRPRTLKPESYTRAGSAAGMGKLASAQAGDLAARGRAFRPGNHLTA